MFVRIKIFSNKSNQKQLETGGKIYISPYLDILLSFLRDNIIHVFFSGERCETPGAARCFHLLQQLIVGYVCVKEIEVVVVEDIT